MSDRIDWVDEMRGFAEQKLQQQLDQVLRCAGLLSDAELWHRVNEHTNSVGNLLLHLSGNVRQWIVGGLGGERFDRNRPAEFAARGPLPRVATVGTLDNTVRAALRIIATLDAAALQRQYTIQGYGVSGVAVVFHVVEHFSFHSGQIVHMTKAIKATDVSLYDARGRRIDGTWP